MQRRQADLTTMDAEDADHPLLLEQVHVSSHTFTWSQYRNAGCFRSTTVLMSSAALVPFAPFRRLLIRPVSARNFFGRNKLNIFFVSGGFN